uniref:Peptidase S1 domain-containing protein n=1 Tax=Anopheles dirus TaxID=7168 RepID=A0A182N6C4_9DIPT
MKQKVLLAVCTVFLIGYLDNVQGLRLAEQKCDEYRKAVASLTPKVTGRTNEFETPPNGLAATEGEFPHQVRVGQWFYEDDDDTAFILRCSGALISERYVLVAGHCFWTMNDEEVSLGRHDYRNNSSFPEDTHLVKLRVNRLPNEECTRDYAGSDYYPQGVTDQLLCAESPVEWKTACEGDAGGLLQTLVTSPSGDFYRVVGLEGKGQDCDQLHKKLTYTSVAQYLDWIESVVWK